MEQSQVFRKVSLDRLSSPEQLDQVMEVTTPRGWAALGALLLLLAAGVVWGFEGSLADKVAGRGILVRSGGVLEVVAPAAGRVSDVAISVGDSVSRGQVVAWITQPELADQAQQARAHLQAALQEQQETIAFANQDAQLQLRALDQQQGSLQQSIRATEESLRWMADRVAAQQQLVAQGLLTKATLLQTRQQHEQTQEKLEQSHSDLAQIAVHRLDVENRRQASLREAELKVAEARADADEAERTLKTSSQVISPYTGRILELMTEQGKIIGRGEPVLSLDLTGRSVQDLVAVIYVPSVQGKMIHPGMQIQLAPSTVRQEEYGMMLGDVTFVSDFPATPRGMQRVLKNDQLVTELSGGGAPYEVHAELTPDPETPSKYRWSSSKGPPISIQSGTLAAAMITVEAQRPITKVIPLFRKWTGI